MSPIWKILNVTIPQIISDTNLPNMENIVSFKIYSLEIKIIETEELEMHSRK